MSWLDSITSGDVRSFYAGMGVELGQESNNEAPARCWANTAAHKNDDRVKSVSVNLETGVWYCHGCGMSGNEYREREATQNENWTRPKKQKPKVKLPGERDLKKWRKTLASSPALLERLKELKCWAPQAIYRCGVGWDGERITFPARNQKLKVQGVARYLPGASGGEKMRAVAGSVRGLFPAPETIDRKRVLYVVEGEPDAVSMWSIGLAAVAVPGANSWRMEWAPRLVRFRKVIVIMDCDEPGRQLARLVGRLPKTEVVDLEPGRNDGYDVGQLICEAHAEGGVWQAKYLLEQLGGAA